MNLRDLKRAASLEKGRPAQALVLSLIEVAETARAYVHHGRVPVADLRAALDRLANLETP